jgi:hypothetical protein
VGEVATIDPGEDRKTKLLPYQIYDTLEYPNAVSVEASQHRLQAALGAGVLERAPSTPYVEDLRRSVQKALAVALDPEAQRPPREFVRRGLASESAADVHRSSEAAVASKVARPPYVPNCSPGFATLHTRRQCSQRKYTT